MFLLAFSFMISGSISILSIWNTDTSNAKTNKYIGSTITIIGFFNGLITLITNHLDYKTCINI